MQHATRTAAATVAATSCTCMCHCAVRRAGGSERQHGASGMASQNFSLMICNRFSRWQLPWDGGCCICCCRVTSAAPLPPPPWPLHCLITLLPTTNN